MVTLSPYSPVIPCHDPLGVRLGKLEWEVKIMKQELTSKIAEVILTLKNRHLSSLLDNESNNNRSLKEKISNLQREVRNLQEELTEEKEKSTNGQILTFGKIMRFFLDKILALFSFIFSFESALGLG